MLLSCTDVTPGPQVLTVLKYWGVNCDATAVDGTSPVIIATQSGHLEVCPSAETKAKEY